MKSGWLANLGIAIASTAIALGLAEAAVRLWVPVRNVGPSFTAYDSVYGKRLKRNFHALRYAPEFTMTFTTNSQGFRGPPLDSLGRRPVLFMGDSYTMGYGVSDGEEFPALIRRALDAQGRRSPVINAGMGDNGNGRWVKFLRHEGRRLNPRLVVLQLSDNDFDDNVIEGLFTLTRSGELLESPVPSPGWPRIAQELVEAVPGLSYSRLLGLSRQAVPRPGRERIARSAQRGPAEGPLSSSTDGLTYQLIEETLGICGREHWPVLALEVGVDEPRLGELDKIFTQHRITLLRAPTSSERPDLYYRIDGHWNIRAHRLIAQQLLPYLEAALKDTSAPAQVSPPR